jgi:hypothetical protein
MKILLSKAGKPSGNILLVTMLTAIVIGLTLISFLSLVDGQSKSVQRSQTWNQSLVVTEAGIEDAMSFINQYAGTQDIGAWTNTASANHWTASGNVFTTTRYLDAAHTIYYTAWVTNVNFATPSIRCTGSVPGPSWLNNPNRISRTVYITAKTTVLFNAAMAALGTIDLKGNNIATDSFDSSATNYPGYWTTSIRRANGDVATDGTILNVLNVGNANLAGHVMTGPGGSVNIAANGSVGDLPWVDASTPGIKPGYLSDDMNVNFENVVIPSPPQVVWTGAPGSGNATVYSYTGTTITGTNSGRSFAHLITGSGNYTINDSGDIYVASNCVVNLKVIPSVGTFNPNMLYGAGTGTNAAKVTCYVDCANCTLGTDDKPQGGGLAGNMVFLGTPNCTSLSYKGNGDFTGAMYFPQADFQLAGGGSGIVDFIGSSVTKTVQMNGHYHFHFDEALKKWNPNNAYVAASWREL